MTSVDGGQIAARGFHFQYLVTVDRLLDMVDGSSEATTLHVEHSGAASGATADEQAIDLAARDSHGALLWLSQIKSVEQPEQAQGLGANDAVRVLRRLATVPDAHTYEIVTNRRLATTTMELVSALGNQASMDELTRIASEVGTLDAAELTALRASRIESIGLTVPQYRSRVQERVRQLRIARRDGTGIDSSAMVTAFLVDNVFQAAASSDQVAISRATATEWVGASPAVIAAALGDYDWGNTIGVWPSPSQVTRRDLLTAIDSALNRDRGHDVRSPKTVVVNGLSGGGKSSLAAHHAYLHAYDYELMVWIDAESADTLRASFGRLLSALHPGRDVDNVESATVAAELSRRPGRCLLVFDNSVDWRVAAEWVPKHGNLDIIITTIDSTVWSSHPHVEVMKMPRADSLDLLRAHLPGWSGPETALDILAGKLADWPLALSMAAGYLYAIGALSSDAIESYLDKIDARIIDDEPSIPEDYPRTIAAAIRVGLDGILTTAWRYPEGVAALAQSVMFTAAYFAEAGIPTQLLAASTLASPESMQEQGLTGPTVMLGAEPEIHDVVRLLRSRSFVDRSTVTRNDGCDEFMADRLSLNGITQLVLRAEIVRKGSDKLAAHSIRRSSYHTNQWLQVLIDKQRFARVIELVPHAERLVSHAEHAGLADIWIALLAGNLAVAYRTMAKYEQVRDVLRYEIDQVTALDRRGELPRSLAAKVAMQLLEAHIRCGSTADEMARVATVGITALTEMDRAQIDPDLVSAFATNFGVLIEQGLPPGDRRELTRQLDALTVDTSPNPVNTVRRIHDLLQAGRDQEAITTALQALEGQVQMPITLQLRGQLAEARAYCRDFEGALRDLATMMDLLDSPLSFPDTVLEQLNNIGNAATDAADTAGAHALIRATVHLGGPRLAHADEPTRVRHERLQSILQRLETEQG